MIIIISEKTFLKNRGRLCKKGKYVIVNTTDNDKITNMGSVHAGDSFQILDPPPILTEKHVSDHVKDKKVEGWLGCPEARKAFATIAFMQISDHGEISKDPVNKNVFVVLSKKGYKHCKKLIIGKMIRLFKLDEDDGPVVIDFKKAYKYADGDIHNNIKDEIKRLDKKIDKLVEEVEYGDYDIFDDKDMHEREKKLKKLRSRRKQLVKELDENNESIGSSNKMSDEILCNCIKRGFISKSARKKLANFTKKFIEKDAIADYTTRYF